MKFRKRINSFRTSQKHHTTHYYYKVIIQDELERFDFLVFRFPYDFYQTAEVFRMHITDVSDTEGICF